jgi:hypothetical protein
MTLSWTSLFMNEAVMTISKQRLQHQQQQQQRHRRQAVCQTQKKQLVVIDVEVERGGFALLKYQVDNVNKGSVHKRLILQNILNLLSITYST